MKYYVLVSQGIEIYRTTNKEEAEKIMNESNERWYKHIEECVANYDPHADNEVFMYEKEVEG